MGGIKDYLKLLKLSSVAYNYFHKNELKHNAEAYRQYGIEKALYKNISSADFRTHPQVDLPWLDTDISEEVLQNRLNKTSFNTALKSKLLSWKKDGFIILNSFFSEQQIDEINTEVNRLLTERKSKLNDFNKIMFANKQSNIIKCITENELLCNILRFILGKEVVPFQTINFLIGSEQKTHSDSIHMTTFPLGYLIAAWIALEDISEEQGPVHYYPGSHRLKYILNDDYEKKATRIKLGHDKHYSSYEKRIENLISENQLSKTTFTAKKGDVLIWHANLLHGGNPITKIGSTRKSMVIHYFAKGVVKYHEISERPANFM